MAKIILFAVVFSMNCYAQAAEHQELQAACKAECPAAKSEDDAHKCMEEVVKKKKNDRNFRKTDCYSVFKEHAEHEKEKGHNH